MLGDHGAVVATFAAAGTTVGAISPFDDSNLGFGGDDSIEVGDGDNVVLGGDGDDDITAGGGDDVVVGDHGDVFATFTAASTFVDVFSIAAGFGGDDVIEVGDGDNVVLGGDGSDVVLAGDGDNVVLGDHGSVLATFTAATTTVETFTTDPGEGGDDLITLGDGDHVVLGGDGVDDIFAGDGDNVVLGDHGAVEATFTSAATTVDARTAFAGTGDDDVITVGDGNHVILGGDGFDDILAGDGNNVVFGDHGHVVATFTADTTMVDAFSIFAAAGGDDDLITVGDGDHVILGGDGFDDIFAGDGDNVVFGDHGDVVATFTADATVVDAFSIFAATGGDDDVITVGDGDHVILGGDGFDDVLAGDGDNVVFGDHGDVVATFTADATVVDAVSLFAGVGGDDDVITVGDGDHVILGGDGFDDIFAGDGDNVVFGDHGDVVATFTAAGTVVDAVSIFPGAGDDDIITVGDGNHVILGGDGFDDILAGDGDNVVFGDHGDVVATFTADAPSSTRSASSPGRGDDDIITVGDGDHVILGGDGFDDILAGDGNNVVFGDHGDVVATFTAAGTIVDAVSIFPGAGDDDIITVGDGNHVILGGDGFDEILAGDGDNVVFGDHGDVEATFTADTTTVDAFSLFAATGGDDDSITVGDGDHVILGGDGFDEILAGDGDNVVFGDHGDVEATFTADTTTVDAFSLFAGVGGGHDLIAVGDGDHVILGGDGVDDIGAGDGDNVVFGDHGAVLATFTADETTVDAVSLFAGVGGDDDLIIVGDGDHVILGGDGIDVVMAGEGDNVVFGDHGTVLATFTADETTVDAVSVFAGVGGDDDLIIVGDGDDVILGGDGVDEILAAEGDNVVFGDHGTVFATFTADETTVDAVSLFAGVGGDDDLIEVGDGDDVVLGGDGVDEIRAAEGDNVVIGDHGDVFAEFTAETTFVVAETTDPGFGDDDLIEVGDGDDVVLGGDGSDEIDAANGDNAVLGDHGVTVAEFTVDVTAITAVTTNPGAGDSDVITVGDGDDVVLGGDGADDIVAAHGDNVVLGDHGTTEAEFTADSTTVTAATTEPGAGDSDLIEVGDGDDVVLGGDGSDFVFGGEGDNVVLGDHGSVEATFTVDATTVETLTTEPGAGGSGDLILVGDGDDVVLAGDGTDLVFAGDGDNVVLGDHGEVFAEFTAGATDVDAFTTDAGAGDDDVIEVGAGDDVVLAGDGDDFVVAGNGDNVVLGDHGEVLATFFAEVTIVDALTTEPGAGGDDDITTGGRNDVVLGGDGDDFVVAGNGDNVVLGDHGDVSVTFVPQFTRVDAMTTEPGAGGDDDITTGDGDDVVFGGDGDDFVVAGNGDNVVLGDHGEVLATFFAEVTIVDALTTEPSAGGDDDITTGDGHDVVLGGGGADDIAAGDGNNVVLGDHGAVAAVFTPVAAGFDARTTDPGFGGDDTITSGDGNDVVLGGDGADMITVGAGTNVVLGDSGGATPTLARTSDPGTGSGDTITAGSGADIVLGGDGADDISTAGGNDIVLGDQGFVQFGSGPILIATMDPTRGAGDVIDAGDGNDIVLAGSGPDVVTTGDGNDLVFGDHGIVAGTIDAALLPLSMPTPPFGWTSIDVNAPATGGGGDLIRGGAGDDIVIGGQGSDRITTADGDDDVIGGHNVPGGADGGDFIDAGAGNDWVAGDNANLRRLGDSWSPRFRALLGATIYDDFGNPLIGGIWFDPNPFNEERAVQLFDHSSTATPGANGDDVIAGGPDDDVIFGQLGNDWIQGDGSAINDDGVITIDVVRTRQSVEDIGGAGTDGRDYIEGNGGDDTIFGGLGQDDLIGGSSSLYSLTTPDLRTNGRDTIFGGAGTRLERNTLGDTSPIGHARDADVILGDNGNIYGLIGTFGIGSVGVISSAYLTFNYDIYSGITRIIPRAYQFLDYTQGSGSPTDLVGDDLLHGEDGDDTVHGMGGNDVIFGEAHDDDLYGGTGYDRIFGGTGEDGILGDDGKFLTSRNGMTEPLNGLFTPNLFDRVELGDGFTGSFLAWPDRLKKEARLANWTAGGNDIIYGGLGDDWLHGGAGDDAISGAEAMREWYNELPQTDPNPLRYNADLGRFEWWDPNDPRAKIEGFFLNFDAYVIHEDTGHLVLVGGLFVRPDLLRRSFAVINGVPVPSNDGLDHLFGDNGNDWLVGGTYFDRMFGGWGEDLMNLDDNLETNGGRNDRPEDDLWFRQGDFAFGGADRDIFIGNSGQDRMIDWQGDFNAFYVPFEEFGPPTIYRFFSPLFPPFIRALAFAGGTDSTLTPFEPFDEPAIIPPGVDPDNPDQTGPPRFPQPGNVPGVPHDDVRGTNPDCVCFVPLRPEAALRRPRRRLRRCP